MTKPKSTGQIWRDCLTPMQLEAWKTLTGPATNILFNGGGGGGKTHVYSGFYILRALRFPGSVQGIFRATQNSIRGSVWTTFRKALQIIDPAMVNPDSPSYVKFNESNMEIEFPNGSKVLCYGLDDVQRIEKLFGIEFSTIWVNEVSQIKEFDPIITTLLFRLRQNVEDGRGNRAPKKMIFDCNPPSKSHWTYRRFVRGIMEDGRPLPDPQDWVMVQVNTRDNLEILGEDYLKRFETLGVRERRRLLEGEFLDATEGSLFPGELIDRLRHTLPEDTVKRAIALEELKSTFIRIVIGVDPATTNKRKSDLTGICVVALNETGHAYVLEDATMKGSPSQWAAKVAMLYEKWNASCIVAETNQGGDMVGEILLGAGLEHLPIRTVHARVGKMLRAEPVSNLYERELVHHVDVMRELEEQMDGFTYAFNPSKDKSPDRMDALVYALTELMLERQIEPSAGFIGRI